MMSKRSVIFVATAILAISVAVPAFGGPSNPVADTFASAKKTAKKALKKAKTANKAAKQAQKSADAAQVSANDAQSTANGAQTAAEAAQATADQAVTDAATAQAAADAAQATADSKYGEMDFVSGESSESNSDSNKVVSAGCGSGREVTGGGYAVNGPGNNDVTVTMSSQYLNGWLVIANEIGAGTGDNWSVGATVTCIS